MELQLPTIVLKDGTSAPFQLTRRRISTDKLPVPSGARLTLTRGKLGDGLYTPTTDFLRTGTCMRIPDPIYNNLHDPHLRHYFQRRDRRNALKEGNFITDDNEVICSLKAYNTYEEYLRGLKKIVDKTYDGTQSAKMEKVAKLQKKGRIPGDVTLEEVMESILEDDSQNLRRRLRIEAAKKRQKGQTDVENENQLNEEALYTELDLLSWKAEDRSRLMLYEKQHRHEMNRDTFLKKVQEQKDRRKQALVKRKCSSAQRKLQEKMARCKEAEVKRCRSRGPDEGIWELSLGEPRGLPENRSCVKRPALRSAAARVYGVNASHVFQALPALARKDADDRRKFPERARGPRERVAEAWGGELLGQDERGESSPADSLSLLPLRPRVAPPGLRPGAARVYGLGASKARQKLPSLEQKGSGQ